MALIKCKECGHAVSSTAAACPNCGAAPRRGASRAIGLVVVGVALAALSWRFASIEADSEKPSSAQAVHPAELQGAKTFELGELVLLFMPDEKAEGVGWDHRADSGIAWKTAGYGERKRDDGMPHYFRDGLVRAHVGDQVAHVLQQREVELAWTVAY